MFVRCWIYLSFLILISLSTFDVHLLLVSRHSSIAISILIHTLAWLPYHSSLFFCLLFYSPSSSLFFFILRRTLNKFPSCLEPSPLFPHVLPASSTLSIALSFPSCEERSDKYDRIGRTSQFGSVPFGRRFYWRQNVNGKRKRKWKMATTSFKNH